MSNTKENWKPWPEPRFAHSYEVSSRGRVRSRPRTVLTSEGVPRELPPRQLTIAENRTVGFRGTRRSVPKAVLAVFGKLPSKWA